MTASKCPMADELKISMPSLPFPAHTVFISEFSSISFIRSVFTGWSSHKSTVMPASLFLLLFFTFSVLSGIFSAFLTGRYTINCVPAFSSVSSSIKPSIISTRLLTIESPRPVPSILVTALVSSWEYGSNAFLANSLLIPEPLSHTVILQLQLLTVLSRNSAISWTVPPLWVNFIAFESRFKNICLNLRLSTYTTPL